ncbi:hypothetical protein [Clostridium saccharoperbutylacetonicum]|uniref:hypothetical protein n=1 Tax=Clostridium saccharoperbutylacetonicum TaxID=36745 RepID=UPI0039EAA438
MTKTDFDVHLDIINFDFDDLSLTISNSGYWATSVKTLLQLFINDIDDYFEILYTDKNEVTDEIENQFPNSNNLRFSSSSLEQLQAKCEYLINSNDIFDQAFIEKFNKICIYMNDFWRFWFE